MIFNMFCGLWVAQPVPFSPCHNVVFVRALVSAVEVNLESFFKLLGSAFVSYQCPSGVLGCIECVLSQQLVSCSFSACRFWQEEIKKRMYHRITLSLH